MTSKNHAPGPGGRHRSIPGAATRIAALLLTTTLAVPLVVPAARAAPPAALGPISPPSAASPLETTADELNYDRVSGCLEARGHVRISDTTTVLRADHISINMQTQDAEAHGNVILQRGESIWKGESLTYNFKTGLGNYSDFSADMPPFKAKAEKVERAGTNTFILHNAQVTTCDCQLPDCAYYVSASEIEIVPGQSVKARNAVWHFGRLPVMYVPYWYKNLDNDFGYTFKPGQDSEWGPFLLSSCWYRMSPELRGETHLDFRREKGLAGGQDLRWRSAQDYNGLGSVYFAKDKDPSSGDSSRSLDALEEQRYRFHLDHSASLSDNDTLLLRGDYLSDLYMMEDFFESELESGSSPANHVFYGHTDDGYQFGALLAAPLNKFYGGVRRLPQLSLDLTRARIGDSAFYYENHNTAASLSRVQPESSSDPEYSAVRLDSDHMFYRPDRIEFLTVIPRAGIRGTYYSKSRDFDTRVEVANTVETNFTVTASGATQTIVTAVTSPTSSVVETEGGSAFRTRPQVGFETSFKAFRVTEDDGFRSRHVVEPYANWTFAPEPNVTPDELYSFDDVDALDKEHHVRFGARNKWQEKSGKFSADLLDLDVYTYYKIHRPEEEEPIEDIFAKSELRVPDWPDIDIDGIYNQPDAQLRVLNSRLLFHSADTWSASFEHRYTVDESSLLSGNLVLFASRGWQYGYNARYEIEDKRLEEQGGFIQRTLQCIALRTGLRQIAGYTRADGSERDDEWRITLEFWLTAFPRVGVGGTL